VTHPNAADIDYLDHTVLLTEELDAAAARFRELGFTVSPPSAHMAANGTRAMRPTGTANQCAYFGESFIELLGTSSTVRNPLARYRGLHLTLGCGDVEVVAHRWRADGISSTELWHMQREVDTEDGKRMVRATSVRVDLDLTPEGGLQAAQHLTPEYVHQRRYLGHPNGALRLDRVLVVVPDDDVDASVDRYRRIVPATAQTDGPMRVLPLRVGDIAIIPASAAAEVLPGHRLPALPLIAAHVVAVTDLAAARRLVEGNGIPTHDCPGGFFVAAQDACGIPLGFVPGRQASGST
jgi:hypothetical protein